MSSTFIYIRLHRDFGRCLDVLDDSRGFKEVCVGFQELKGSFSGVLTACKGFNEAPKGLRVLSDVLEDIKDIRAFCGYQRVP